MANCRRTAYVGFFPPEHGAPATPPAAPAVTVNDGRRRMGQGSPGRTNVIPKGLKRRWYVDAVSDRPKYLDPAVSEAMQQDKPDADRPKLNLAFVRPSHYGNATAVRGNQLGNEG
jgi:hypothetical protein